MKNYNQHKPYIRDVSEEDYAVMKAEESHMVKEVKTKLYEEGITPAEKQLPSFVYNPRRQIVALYFQEGRRNRKEDRRLILNKVDVLLMSELERKAFFAMRCLLEEGLEGIRMKEVE